MAHTLISKRATAERIGVHVESLMRWVREGKFPKPIRTGPTPQHRVFFIVDEVDSWIAERAAARHSESAA